MKNSNWILTLFLTGIIASCSNSESYDLVLSNGKIWTGEQTSPWAKWVAIKENEIAATGETNAPNASQTIDLKGRLMVPGFNDSHVHFASAGSLLLGINLLDVNSDSLFRARVIEATGRLPEGSWITRGDWGAYEAWAAGSSGGGEKKRPYEPYRALIDDVTNDYPVLVTRYDRLVGMANKAALDYLGIESKTGVLRGT
ncbi:MAG: amidohydrolase family protein, partial [Cyclobacteriaceae bacterium]